MKVVVRPWKDEKVPEELIAYLQSLVSGWDVRAEILVTAPGCERVEEMKFIGVELMLTTLLSHKLEEEGVEIVDEPNLLENGGELSFLYLGEIYGCSFVVKTYGVDCIVYPLGKGFSDSVTMDESFGQQY